MRDDDVDGWRGDDHRGAGDDDDDESNEYEPDGTDARGGTGD